MQVATFFNGTFFSHSVGSHTRCEWQVPTKPYQSVCLVQKHFGIGFGRKADTLASFGRHLLLTSSMISHRESGQKNDTFDSF